ncbi:MAG: class I SAM-dependent methyltransferase [Phycisphaerae bacterium]|nr:class I SAM-dependent methyltransferase [Phycisphaerae bacterium]
MNPQELSISSRLIADIFAAFYDRAIRKYCYGRVVDLGCGKAPLYALYRDYSTEVTLVDWADTAHKANCLDLECNLNNPLPFQDNAFETIVLSDVLEHIHSPALLWNEMYRILSPGGKILLNTPFYYWLHEIPHDYYRYTEFGLRYLAEQAKFRICELEAIGGFYEIITDLFAKKLVKTKIIGKPFAAFIQTACLWLTSRGMKKKKTTPFPFGYFMVVEK